MGTFFSLLTNGSPHNQHYQFGPEMMLIRASQCIDGRQVTQYLLRIWGKGSLPVYQPRHSTLLTTMLPVPFVIERKIVL